MAEGLTTDPGPRTVRAAGGVVTVGERDSAAVLLVHRRRRDDWSLPKGKLERGEHPLVAAVREVREETGVTGRPGVRLPTVSYPVATGETVTPKTVDWWHMTVGDVAGFDPSDEVDRIAWLPVPAALTTLSYPHDRRVLQALSQVPPVTASIVLLRHAHAGDRDAVTGPDVDRPLDDEGRRQASAVGNLLALWRPRALVSAPPLRCRQTLAEAARRSGLGIAVDTRFQEGSDPREGAGALRDIAVAGQRAVICSQGGIIPAMLAHLIGRTGPQLVVGKGCGFVLSFAADRLVAADPVGINEH